MYHAPSVNRPPSWVLRRMPPGTQYLGEDETYWYFSHPTAPYALGGFFDDVGKMFTRMFKFTPKSFTPGNIYKGFVNTTLTAVTGGIYQFLPKDIKNKVYKVSEVAIPVVSAAVGAYYAGPAVMAVIGPKLTAAGSLLGKAATTIGGQLFNMIGKFSQAGQAEVAQNITPEQLAQMEQTGQIPASLQPILDRAAQMSFSQPPANQPVPVTAGAAQLYDPSAMAALEMQRQQQAQGSGFDPTMLLMIAAPVALVMLSGKK